MDELNNMDEILDFAIEGEEESHKFYLELAEKMDRPAMREVFEGFAQEELGHKARLEAVKKGSIALAQADRPVTDLKIADYVVMVELKADMDYQEALLVAMKKEKAAFRLYSDLAARAQSSDLREMFLSLAQEEAKHKLRFEIEYDDVILTDN